MRCDICCKDKPDVTMGLDPYSYEIDGDDTEYPLCEDCWEMRKDDI